MPTLIPRPTRIQSAGNKPKLIDEYIGRVNSQTTSASVAHMRSPAGWIEPGQTPAFDEFTIVLKGTLRVEYQSGSMEVTTEQAVIAHAGEWIPACSVVISMEPDWYSTRRVPLRTIVNSSKAGVWPGSIHPAGLRM